MNAQQMWEKYTQLNPQYSHCSYESYAYCAGENPYADELAQLTVTGHKTATSSPYQIYELENQPLPQVGDFNIILDAQEKAVCITRHTKVEILPFDQVSDEHAYKEGEGDKTLDYWRQVHAQWLSMYLEEFNLEFTTQTPMVCEEFEVVYPKQK